MSKLKRLTAALQGKTAASDTSIQESIVKNMLDSDKLATQAALAEIQNAKTEALKAIACSDCREKGLNALFQAFMDEHELNERLDIHKAVEKYLNEETEVSD